MKEIVRFAAVCGLLAAFAQGGADSHVWAAESTIGAAAHEKPAGVVRMKISIDIDMTPEEARRFLGLPDLEPMQQAILQDVQERLQKNIARVDPDSLFKTWFALAPQGMEQLQKMFGSLATMATGGRRSPGKKSEG